MGEVGVVIDQDSDILMHRRVTRARWESSRVSEASKVRKIS